LAHEKGRGRGAGAFLAQVRSGCGAGARRLAEVIAAAQATDLRPGRWRIISVRLWRGATDLWRIRHPSIAIGGFAGSASWDAMGNWLRPTDQTCVVPREHRAARRRPRVRRYCPEDRPGPRELIDLRSRSWPNRPYGALARSNPQVLAPVRGTRSQAGRGRLRPQILSNEGQAAREFAGLWSLSAAVGTGTKWEHCSAGVCRVAGRGAGGY